MDLPGHPPSDDHNTSSLVESMSNHVCRIKVCLRVLLRHCNKSEER